MYKFDSLKGKIEIKNNVILLTARETEIFEILDRNKKKYTTLSELAEEVYGEDTERYRENVRILMWRLKKKLENYIKIRTFYGKGFLIV